MQFYFLFIRICIDTGALFWYTSAVQFYCIFPVRKGRNALNSVADIWTTVLQKLQKDLSETTISTWFDELEPIDIREFVFYFHCPNDFKKGYIESLFIDNIQAALQDIFSHEFEVKILDDEEYAAFQSPDEGKKNRSLFESDEFTFETFVVGPSNKLAYAAARSVAEKPAANYNPLLIYGDSGLGKTHLLYAIAHLIRKNNAKAKIAYVKGDDFINQFIELIRAGRGSEFRARYREADLLLVDDVQFVAGKEQVQNEFFHTFNTLYESGKQIVLTSDRPPSEMTLLDDRLRTLEGEAILRNLAFQLHSGIADNAQLLRLHSSLVGIGQRNINCVGIKDLSAIHPLNNLAGSLARAETGNADLLAGLQIGLVDSSFKILRTHFDGQRDKTFFQFFTTFHTHFTFPPFITGFRPVRIPILAEKNQNFHSFFRYSQIFFGTKPR